MGRWEPDAEGRFRTAALELFVERGYELTTVADIAERAGLTSRTFFRHFVDKREVLFNGSERLQELMVTALISTRPNAAAIEAVEAALSATASFFSGDREFARKRNSVVMANPDLYERELIKMATLSTALAGALRSRGVAEPDASLAAEAGIGVFRIAFGQWVAEADQRGFGEIVRESLARLRTLTTPL